MDFQDGMISRRRLNGRFLLWSLMRPRYVPRWRLFAVLLSPLELSPSQFFLFFFFLRPLVFFPFFPRLPGLFFLGPFPSSLLVSRCNVFSLRRRCCFVSPYIPVLIFSRRGTLDKCSSSRGFLLVAAFWGPCPGRALVDSQKRGSSWEVTTLAVCFIGGRAFFSSWVAHKERCGGNSRGFSHALPPPVFPAFLW